MGIMFRMGYCSGSSGSICAMLVKLSIRLSICTHFKTSGTSPSSPQLFTAFKECLATWYSSSLNGLSSIRSSWKTGSIFSSISPIIRRLPSKFLKWQYHELTRSSAGSSSIWLGQGDQSPTMSLTSFQLTECWLLEQHASTCSTFLARSSIRTSS